MKLPFKASFATLALSLAAASSPALAAEPAGEGARLRQFYQQLGLAYDQLGTCNRDSRGIRMGIATVMWDIGDRIRIDEGEAAAKALGSLPKLPAPACGSQVDQQLQMFTHEQSFEAISRLLMLRLANSRPGWPANIGAIPGLPPLVDALRMQLGQNVASVRGTQAVDGRMQQLGNELETELALVCDARKTLRSAAPRACPALPATVTKAHRDMAAARVANLELLAERLATSGENPFGTPFGFHSSSDMMGWTMRTSAKCVAALKVVYPGDPGAVRSAEGITLPLREFGSGKVVGSVGFKSITASYPMVLSPLRMTSGIEEYNRCPNALS